MNYPPYYIWITFIIQINKFWFFFNDRLISVKKLRVCWVEQPKLQTHTLSKLWASESYILCDGCSCCNTLDWFLYINHLYSIKSQSSVKNIKILLCAIFIWFLIPIYAIQSLSFHLFCNSYYHLCNILCSILRCVYFASFLLWFISIAIVSKVSQLIKRQRTENVLNWECIVMNRINSNLIYWWFDLMINIFLNKNGLW